MASFRKYLVILGTVTACVGCAALFLIKRSPSKICGVKENGSAKIVIENGKNLKAYEQKPFAWAPRLNSYGEPQNFDLFTAPSIYYQDDKLVIKTYKSCIVDEILPLYLADISRRPYRIKIDGYTRQFDDDTSCLVRFRDIDSGVCDECDVGKTSDKLGITLKSFHVKKYENDGIYSERPVAVIYDKVFDENFELTNENKFFDNRYNVIIRDMKGNDFILKDRGDTVVIGDATCQLESFDVEGMTAKLLLTDSRGQKFHRTVHVAR